MGNCTQSNTGYILHFTDYDMTVTVSQMGVVSIIDTGQKPDSLYPGAKASGHGPLAPTRP